MLHFPHKSVEPYVEGMASVRGQHGIFAHLDVFSRSESDVPARYDIALDECRVGRLVKLDGFAGGGVSYVFFFDDTRLLAAVREEKTEAFAP